MVSRLDRVVQVVRRERDGHTYFEASGFLLVGDLAITAAHAVRDKPAGLEVRGPGRGVRAVVQRVVPHPDRDVALLVLDTECLTVPPIRFALLPQEMGQIAVHAVGYPWFTEEDGRPSGHQIDGTIQLGSDRRAHQLQLSVHSSDPRASGPKGSPWEGYSGAGILTKDEGLLAGVATSHLPGRDRRNVTATDLCDLGDPDFLSLLAAHRVEAEPVPLRRTATAADAVHHWLEPPVRAVLDRQREAADELPYRFHQDRRTRRLTTVYIRQVLSRGLAPDDPADLEQLEKATEELKEHPAGREGRPRRGASHRPGQAPARPAGPSPAKQAGPPRRLEDVLDEMLGQGTGGHLLVEAGPGTGKSTLLHNCALRYGREALDSAVADGRFVPVWVAAARLAGAGHSLESAVAAETGLGPGDGTLPRLPEGVRWLLLVDALDEVHHDQRGRVIRRLADQAGQGTRSPIRMVLTTRPDPEAIEELVAAGFHHHLLDPFDRKRLEEFAGTWFKDSGHPGLAMDFLRQIDDAGLSDPLRNPLLATVTAIVFENAPGDRLPDNRRGLYLRYRALLREARSGQVETMWRKLEQRASVTSRGRDAVACLRDGVETLLAHLAHAQVVRGEQDLPEVARRWWEETAADGAGRRFGADEPLAGWPNAVTDALLGTGLLVRKGHDLEFLHTTFAEHLVAEHLVEEELTESFDIAHPRWRAAILAASGRTGHHLEHIYRLALAHYCHRHRAGGRKLLDWLQAGLDPHQLLAGELLAARCPAEEIHYRRLLASVDSLRVSAPEGRIWDLLSRTRHERVQEYLHRIAHQPDAPSRMEAVVALLPHDSVAAARILVQVADLPSVEPQALQRAAEALAGSLNPAEAATVLRAVTRHRHASPTERLSAAQELAELGEEHVESAARALLALVDEVPPPPLSSDQAKALQSLVELGGDHARQAERRIERLACTLLRGTYQEIDLARGMAKSGGRSVAAAARILHAVVEAPLTRDFYRSMALEELIALGGPHVEEAARCIRALVDDTGTSPRERRGFARMLEELGDEYQDLAADAYRAVLHRADAGFTDRLSATQGLQRLGGTYAQEAQQSVGTLRSSPRRVGSVGHGLARRFLRLKVGSGEDDAVERWRRYVTYPRSHPLYLAVGVAARFGRKYPADPVAAICVVLSEPDGPTRYYLAVVEQLRKLGGPLIGEVVEELRTRLTVPDTGRAARLGATRAMLALGELRPPVDTALLRTLVTDPDTDTRIREKGVEVLTALGEEQLSHVASELRTRLTDRRTDRRHAARTLRELGESYVESVAASLAADATRPEADAGARRLAAGGLLLLGGPHVPVDGDRLYDIAVHRECSHTERLHALEVLLLLQPWRAAELAGLVYSVGSGTLRTVFSVEAARLLLQLGEKHRPTAVRAFRQIIRAKYHLVGDVARTIALLGEPYAGVIARSVPRRRSLRRPGVGERLAVGEFLLGLGREYRGSAVTVLLGVIRGRRSHSYERTYAAKRLAALGGEHADTAVKALREAGRRTHWDQRMPRTDMAEFLIARGGEYRSEAAEHLVEIILRQDAEDLGLAAALLAGLGEEFRARAVSALRQVLREDPPEWRFQRRGARWYARRALAALQAADAEAPATKASA
ncbi:trypsin-like peptidase domain-containing protein [Streptomyces sp. NPDC046915]|uniref:trypsin-like peptidase domain-containing protein n=1 Tax=Streptomyces sp. NPDC046915 TaxID=3155257 RepID=UPI0033F36947